jgi:hypothetical protein
MNLQKKTQAGRYGKKAKRTRKNPTVKVKESGLQKSYEDICAAYGVKNIHIPDNFWTWFHYAHKAGNVPDKVYFGFCEMFKGMPDNISQVPIGDTFNLSYTCELKTKTGRLSADQKDWAKEINVPVLRSTEENEKAIIELVSVARQINEKI